MQIERRIRQPALMLVVCVLMAVVFVATGCSPGVMPPDPGGRGESWTVMVFVNADNNLEKFGWEDLRSMEMVGSTSRINIVAQFDTYTGSARRYHIQKSSDMSWISAVSSPILQELGEVNMGDPSTLVDFVRFSVERFPADKYALIVWNHGTGFKRPVRNISFDDTFNDSITIPELGWALSQATGYTGRPIEFLGLDACVMNLVEVAYEVSPYVRVMVASQENEPAQGWDYYQWLSQLTAKPFMEGFELARVVVDAYMSFYSYGSVTLSAVDLGKMNRLADALDHFAMAVMSDTKTSFSVYRSIRDSAFSTQGDSDYVDLIDFLNLVLSDGRVTSPSVREAAQNALQEAQSAVFYNRTGAVFAGKAHGIGIYLPHGAYHGSYDHLAFTHDTAWDSMLHALGMGKQVAVGAK